MGSSSAGPRGRSWLVSCISHGGGDGLLPSAHASRAPVPCGRLSALLGAARDTPRQGGPTAWFPTYFTGYLGPGTGSAGGSGLVVGCPCTTNRCPPPRLLPASWGGAGERPKARLSFFCPHPGPRGPRHSYAGATWAGPAPCRRCYTQGRASALLASPFLLPSPADTSSSLPIAKSRPLHPWAHGAAPARPRADMRGCRSARPMEGRAVRPACL